MKQVFDSLQRPPDHGRRIHKKHAVQPRRVVLVQGERDLFDDKHHLCDLHTPGKPKVRHRKSE